MVSIADWVDQLGGMARKRQLVSRGARDHHLTAAVRSGEVVRARNGWYSTLPENSPRLRAVRVGGRLTGLSALAELGAWILTPPPLHVSVHDNAARLRTQWNRHKKIDVKHTRGVVLHWDPPGVRDFGSHTSVGILHALERVVLDEPLETAVAVLDWALHAAAIDRIDFETLILRLPAERCGIADWVDEKCESLPESLARTRLRLAEWEVESQVPLGETQSIDLVVQGNVAIEVDGKKYHLNTFEYDRAKDLEITIDHRHGLRPSANAVFTNWPRVLLAVETALADRGIRRPSHENSGVPSWASRHSRGISGWRRRAPRGSPEFAKSARRVGPVGVGNSGRSTQVGTQVSDAIKVDIWSDVQCPWCYIGKRKFEAAVDAFDGDVEVEYHSFELAPDTPVDFDGTPVDYLSQRKGMPVDQVEQMLARVTGIASSVGLDYDYDHVHQTNTVKAHELIHFAKSKGRQLDMKERLLKAYFVDGRHVGRVEDLADLAAEIGLDRAEVVTALESNAYLADVKQDVAQAEAYGIQGVPFFVFDGRYGVSGAQDPATFANVLEQVSSERESTR